MNITTADLVRMLEESGVLADAADLLTKALAATGSTARGASVVIAISTKHISKRNADIAKASARGKWPKGQRKAEESKGDPVEILVVTCGEDEGQERIPGA